MSPESRQTNEAAPPRNKKALDASAEVVRILEAYMEELERGGRINPEELAAERPELAEPLRQCLASLEFLQSAAMSLRGGSPSPKAPTTYAGAPAGQLGDFRILREIGRGGMGVVYEAEQVSLGRKIALKVLPFAAVMDQRQLARFNNEAHAAGCLQHTNIVPVYSVGCERGVHYYAMQYVEGQSLAEIIRELRRAQRKQRETAQQTDDEKPKQQHNARRRQRATAGKAQPAETPGDSAAGANPADAPVAARIAASDRSDRSDTSDKSDTSDRSDRSDMSDNHHPAPTDATGDNNENARQQPDPPPATRSSTPHPTSTIAHPPPPTPNPPSPIPHPTSPISTHQSTHTPAYFRAAAKLAIQAAEALDHAHQHGVIHRDIKPANLLVDATGNLWITDFGLARIETETGVTLTGDIVGTIRYMSPEQALAKRVVVDYRADIYSLGATLYELLTLEPAYQGRDREELLRQIAFEEPRPPRKINRAIPVELETIVLKAMEKNPNERFATAQELADDLRRFLDGKPLHAKRASPWQRTAKWSRRHRAIVTSGAVILLLATVGLAVSNVLIARQRDRAETAVASEKRQRAEAQRHRDEARRQRDRAEGLRQEAERRRREADQQRRATDRQRKLAEENFRRAREAVDKYLTKVSETELLNVSGLQPLRKDLLELALEYYKGFIAERSEDPAVQADLAAAHFRVGEITSEIGSKEEALQAHQRALEIRKKLVAAKPDSAEYRTDLAKSYRSVGSLQDETGKPKDALASCQKAIGLWEKLVAEAPATAECQNETAKAFHSIAHIYDALGKRKEAVSACRNAVDIRQRVVSENPDSLEFSRGLASSLNSLGIMQEHAADRQEAAASYEKAIAISENLKRRAPSVAKYQSLLAGSYNNAAPLQDTADEKLKWYQKATAVQEEVVGRNPLVTSHQVLLACMLNNSGSCHCSAGRREDALSCWTRAAEIREKIAKDNPTVPDYLLACVGNSKAHKRCSRCGRSISTAFGISVHLACRNRERFASLRRK